MFLRRFVRIGGTSVMVSLLALTANFGAQSPVETSSPEDMMHESQPGFVPRSSVANLGGLKPSINFEEAKSAKGDGYASPLLTQNVFPYQANPIGALIAAGVTLSVMTLRERGEIDLEGILFLLNSSDFYAGLAGTVSASTAQKGAAQLVQVLSRAVQRQAPTTIRPLLDSPTVKTLSNVINGFSQTLAVSSGYEYFSQFWKIATKNIPEAHTVSGFVSSDWLTKKRVLLNLLYYTSIDTNMQKRILDSVYQNRILTFEFIAMNVALYVGTQLGNYLADRYAPGNVWAKRVGPVAASVGLGLLTQIIPDSWKIGVNRSLLRYKIAEQKEDLLSIQKTLALGITTRSYPPKHVRGVRSYLSSGVDLGEDVERVFRARDSLLSLQMQAALDQGNPGEIKALAEASYLETAKDVQNTFSALLTHVQTGMSFTIDEQMAEWIRSGKSAEEISQLAMNNYFSEAQQRHYRWILKLAEERATEGNREAEKVIQFLSGDEKVNAIDVESVLVP